MKNLLYFILSFLIAGVLTISCSKVYAIEGVIINDVCYAYEYRQIEGTVYKPWGLYDSANHTLSRDWSSGFVYANPYYQIKRYKWLGTVWSNTGEYASDLWGLRNDDPAAYQAMATTLAGGVNIHPSSYWPTGPPQDCGIEPPVQCTELEGQYATLQYPTTVIDAGGPYCSSDCELDGPIGVGPIIYSNGSPTGMEIQTFQYTGEDGAVGCVEPEQEPDIETCSEAQDFCDEACAGIEQDFYCDENSGAFYCNCEYPTYTRHYDPDTGEMKSDSDDDGLTNDDPAETDMDNDGLTDDVDPDPDGDGLTTTDQDSDDDGINNRGKHIWTNDDFGPHNGIGADPDLDNDGYPNGSSGETDTDGDGIPDSQDPDIDGDGIGNGPDLDADGDGILDGSETDPDNDGVAGDADPDPDNTGVSEGDTDGDGDVDADDPPVDDGVPTDEEVDDFYTGLSDNNYSGDIDPGSIPEEADFSAMAQGYIDNSPLNGIVDGAEIQLTASDPCIDFPNPYTGGTEQFCFDQFQSYWSAMGYIMVGLCAFLALLLLVGVL